MADEYSLYEAKAKLSALVRQVREGHTIVITVHGQPAAELRPIDPNARPEDVDVRLAGLTRQGVLYRAKREPRDPKAFPVGKRCKGALRRFLDERD
jgi:prevent-host-death family protein